MKDKSKIFIPLTLDNSTKHLLSSAQYIGTGLCAVGIFFTLLLCIIIHDRFADNALGSPLLLIPLFLAITYFIVFIYRKVVIHENRLLKTAEESRSLRKTDISFIWDIFDIKDNTIRYCNGMVGVIVELQHGFLFNRAEQHEQIHRDLCKDAIGGLVRRGYTFLYYNREVKDGNLAPLEKSEQGYYRFKGYPMFDIANMIAQHTHKVCDTIATTEQEFYLMLANSMMTINEIDLATNEFIQSLKGGLYVDCHRMTDAEIHGFMTDLYGINYLDIDHMLEIKFKDIDKTLITVDKIVRDDIDNTLTHTSVPRAAENTYIDYDISSDVSSDTEHKTTDEEEIILG